MGVDLSPFGPQRRHFRAIALRLCPIGEVHDTAIGGLDHSLTSGDKFASYGESPPRRTTG